MRLVKRRFLKLLLLSVVLGSLWMLRISRPKMSWNPSYIMGYSWLEYTNDDGGPEKVCNCSAILLGETGALEQAKLLTITKDFKKSVQIPDEYYINATQDCRCVALNHVIFYGVNICDLQSYSLQLVSSVSSYI